MGTGGLWSEEAASPHVLAGVHSVCQAGRQAGGRARCTEGGGELKGSALAGAYRCAAGASVLVSPAPQAQRSPRVRARHAWAGADPMEGPLHGSHSPDERARNRTEENGEEEYLEVDSARIRRRH